VQHITWRHHTIAFQTHFLTTSLHMRDKALAEAQGTDAKSRALRICALQDSALLVRRAHLGGGGQALGAPGEAAHVVGCGAAQALDHIHTVARLAAARAVVLRAAKVRPALRHPRQLQALHAPARPYDSR
jgi:hypothetical protein